MGSYSFALRDDSLEPDGKLVASIVYDVTMFLVIVVDLRSLRAD
jgi:hypothetical protein